METEQKTKKYNNTEYHKKFISENREKILIKHICEVCMGSYTYFNKSAHKKTKRHQLFLSKLNAL
jgi:hypothetical protein